MPSPQEGKLFSHLAFGIANQKTKEVVWKNEMNIYLFEKEKRQREINNFLFFLYYSNFAKKNALTDQLSDKINSTWCVGYIMPRF